MAVLLLLVIFLVFPGQVVAARHMTITGDKTSLNGEEELKLTASMSGFTGGEQIYLKGAFFKDGSSNYFGYTKKGESWIKNSTKTVEQSQITVGNWDGNVSVKSDYQDTGFSDSGEYKVKLGFYTIAADGDLSSVNWSDNSLTVTLTKPQATPTPYPTSTRIPTPVPTIEPTITIIPTPEPTEEEPEIIEEEVEDIEVATPTSILLVATPSAMVAGAQSHNPLPAAFSLVGLGTGILSIITLVSAIQKQKRDNHHNV